MADDQTTDDKKKKPGLLRRAAGKTVGIALAGTGTIGQALANKISGTKSNRRAAPGVTRKVMGGAVGITLAGTGSFGKWAAKKITGSGNATTTRSQVPGTGKKRAKSEATQDMEDSIQDMGHKIADDINAVRSDMEIGMQFLYGQVKSVDRKINDLRRQANKPDANASTRRLDQQMRDAKGRYAKAGGNSSIPDDKMPLDEYLREYNKNPNADPKKDPNKKTNTASGSIIDRITGALEGGAAAGGGMVAARALATRVITAIAPLALPAAVLGGTYAMRRTDTDKANDYQTDITKYGQKKADVLKQKRSQGITGWLNDKADDVYQYFAGGDKKDAKPNATDGKNVDIDSKADINFTTTADIILKGANITLDAKMVTIRGALSINGKPFDDLKTADVTPTSGSNAQQRYDASVQKYGQQKADELADVQNNPLMGGLRSLGRSMGLNTTSPSADPSDVRPSRSRASPSYRPGQVGKSGADDNGTLSAGAGGEVGNLIAKGESGKDGYNSYNTGTTRSGGAKIDFSKMTLGEVMDQQASRKLFAVGKYQIIPTTMKQIVGQLGVDPNQKFTPELQEKLFRDGLVGAKRPDIKKYITGDSDNRSGAMQSASQEWAAVGAEAKGGRSWYDGDSAGNHASISPAQMGSALDKQRATYQEHLKSGKSPDEAYTASFNASAPQRSEPNSNTLADIMSADKKPSAAAVDLALKNEGLNERKDRQALINYIRKGPTAVDPATTPWCAAYLNASLAQSGIQGSNSAVANSFQRWGMPVPDATKALKGDVMVKPHGHGPGETGGHVGQFTGETRVVNGRTQYRMVAGNSSDQVQRTWEDASSTMFRRAKEDQNVPKLVVPDKTPEQVAAKAAPAPSDSIKKDAQSLGDMLGAGDLDKAGADNGASSVPVAELDTGGSSARQAGFYSTTGEKDIDDRRDQSWFSKAANITLDALDGPGKLRAARANMYDTPDQRKAAQAMGLDFDESTASQLPAGNIAANDAAKKAGTYDTTNEYGESSSDTIYAVGSEMAKRYPTMPDAKIAENIPTPPNLDPGTSDSSATGAALTDSIKSESRGDDKATNIASSTPPTNRGASDRKGSLRAPVNHPESEGPSPGSDGYGDQCANPDGGGLCAV